ncbi:hypothetical protein Taro_045231 [Colocasia esculenta]|uniref:Malectin-like domain-containing protein n=1 Tax=Colocasia esculenta TaxID=4460 RepID=A0A843X4G3_COLES|nr:hypothetical protein [Colocasia esculenta]
MAAAQGCPVVSLGVPAFFFIAAMAQCAVVVLVHGQSQEGFISIDCGIAAGTSYVEADNNITYESDMDYIDTGVNHMILSPSDWPKRYHTLRSFPEGIRNCYKLRPVSSDKKYLVRAGFHYGNYDDKNSTPVFDLYIGVNLWRTLGKDPFIEEIITVVPTDYDSLFVCLVNTGQGTPFISVLELRPIPDSMYLLANKSQSLVLTENRRYYGAIPILRYPRDPYDRIWFNSGVSGVYSLNTTENVKIGTLMDEFQVPSSVLSTAIRTYNTSYHLPLSIKVVNARAGDTIYVLMHFAELELLMSNETRQMNIYQGEGDGSGRLLFANYTPPYLEADARVANATLQGGEDATYNLSIYASASSTRPPMINALESYMFRPMAVLVTHHGERILSPPNRREAQQSPI